MLQLLKDSPRELDLTLIALMQSALQQQSSKQQQELYENLHELMYLDGNLSVQEWAILRLAQYYQSASTQTGNSWTLAQCRAECVSLLSVLTKTGHASEVMAEAAFNDAWAALATDAATYQSEATLLELDSALTTLVRLKPLQKPALLKAMVLAVQHDGRVTAAEYTLLRAIAALLDCPLPPV